MLTGAKILNTLSDHSMCTVSFSVIVTIIGIVMSLPRTLRHVSFMSMFSAACMGIAILLFLVFAGIEPAPGYGYNGTYPAAGPVGTYALPPAGTTLSVSPFSLHIHTFLTKIQCGRHERRAQYHIFMGASDTLSKLPERNGATAGLP